MSPREAREVDEVAKRLADATKRVLDHSSNPVWGVDWDFDDEDWLRDAARAVEEYQRWETTGEHYFISLRPGLEPQIALADQMLTALGYLSRRWEDYGIELDEDLRREIEELMVDYLRIRKTGVGGPGAMNVETWQR